MKPRHLALTAMFVSGGLFLSGLAMILLAMDGGPILIILGGILSMAAFFWYDKVAR